jgi:hypothetical protein
LPALGRVEFVDAAGLLRYKFVIPNMSTPAKARRKTAPTASPAGSLRKRAAEKLKATKGSKLARQMRQECNQLNDEQRAELLGEAMAMIYGGAVASKAARA